MEEKVELEHANLAKKIREAVMKDLTDIETLSKVEFYQRIFACNPKPYSISGFQHFWGTALISLRLSEFKGLDILDCITAFFAGLLHDYEKIGYRKEKLAKGTFEVIGGTYLYSTLIDIVEENRLEQAWQKAIEISHKLESGGTPLPLQKIVRLVRAGDYITGGREYWKISSIIDLLISEVRIEPKNILPVLFGKPRPIVSMVSGKIEEELENMDAIPLISSPEGMVFLVKKPIFTDAIESVYKSIAYEIEHSLTERIKREKIVRINYNNIVKFIDRAKSGRKPNVGALLSRVKTVRQLNIESINDIFNHISTPADLKNLIIYMVIVYAKSVSKKKVDVNILKKIFQELEIEVTGKDFISLILSAYDKLSEKDFTELKKTSKNIRTKLIQLIREVKRAVDIETITDKIKEVINIGGVKTPIKMYKEYIECAVCRESIPGEGKITLTDYLRSLQKLIRNLRYAEVFHPDALAEPDRISIEKVAKEKLFVCPLCNYESIVFPEKVKFMDGMWSSTLIYRPSAPIDFLKIVRSVISQTIGETLVIPDYMTSRIIVKTSDERGLLRKVDFQNALNLWYNLGGNLVISTVALSSGFTWKDIPIELEKSDVVIEEAVATYMRVLKKAKEERKWEWTRSIRLWLYKTLSDYVKSTEPRKIVRGRKLLDIKLLKSGFATTGYPSIDIYAFFLKRKQL